ncbi:SET and MYND domain-containing protein 4-like [Neocloeon triangulifer]|uniref:SET and MYND domain-containing protein 4-like n=1 Tax=Neocloeon triangulifer TaxID=2078957 RepID=UPI00286EBD6C|nr:SET and MYND domain-containing protein 4-like [Neocloeon triangulifer]XP_059473788.1 SET and MYND domain-containing protein 4-like [Neocloeon triangulifer]XP_059473789.1 SET and MYND domain-containing protein 4-like [Neocloeon triangulifer]XP_059473790.1 SET and MYND domain-containing protein 4-like [Neocloeon triangulifer]
MEPDVLRTNGNEFFRQGDYVRAIALYTKSASVAAADSRPRGLALANRSAVLLALGLYEECLKDVEAAFRCGYPDDLAHKLHLRSAVCHKALGDADKAQKSFQKVLQEFNLPLDKREKVAEDANRQFKEVHVPKVPRIRVQYLNPPELSYGAQQENPALSAGVRKRPNPTLGHVYVAERDLSIGDVILVENPMMYGLTFDYYDSEEKYWTYCHECFKFCLNLTPCPSCSWSLYCSKMCRAEALQKHHRVECGVKQSAIDGILRK